MRRRSFQVVTVQSLAEVLERELGAGQAALVARGAVYVDGRRARDAAVKVSPGQVISVVVSEGGRDTASTVVRAVARLDVVFEDDALLVVNKVPGMLAQPSPGVVGESLLDLASAHLGRTAGLVHRLDKETSGITVFGKSKAVTSVLASHFREGRARKQYIAVVQGELPDSGEIRLPLSRDPSRPGRWRASSKHQGVSAHSEFEVLGRSNGQCAVLLRPMTGRTHQLRAHLAALHAPIVGDPLYGGPRERVPGMGSVRCLLHALSLEIPEGQFRAEPPVDVVTALSALLVKVPVTFVGSAANR